MKSQMTVSIIALILSIFALSLVLLTSAYDNRMNYYQLSDLINSHIKGHEQSMVQFIGEFQACQDRYTEQLIICLRGDEPSNCSSYYEKRINNCRKDLENRFGFNVYYGG